MEQKEKLQWTAKKIIIGKPMMFAAVTLLLFCLMNILCTILVQPILDMVLPNDIFAAAVRVCACLCLVASLWLSVKLLVPACNRKLNAMEPEMAADYFARESKFRWHKAYTIAIGFLLFQAVTKIWISYIVKATESSDNTTWPISVFIYLLVVALLFRGARRLNRYMIRITGTNSELIAEVRNGLHNDKIPADKQQGAALDGIISVLQEGETHNVKTAVVLYDIHVQNRKVWRAALKIAGVGAFLSIFLTNKAFDKFDAEMEEMLESSKRMREHEEEMAAAARAEYEAKEAIKKHKWYEAEQAKKKAYYAKYQASKATAYNPKSYDAYRKRNHARSAYWDWQKADREKYN